MNLRVSGKHMDIGAAFRERIEGRIGEAIDKYFDGGFSGQVTVAKTGTRFTADCLVHLDSGVALQTSGQAQEPTAAFDDAAERFEKRLRRYKRRLKSHQGNGNGQDAVDISYTVMSGFDEDDEEIPDDYAPTVVAEQTLALRTLSVAQAVIELDLQGGAVLVFNNAGTGAINIVYRRNDGNIGWIDPSNAAKKPN
ncbi:ribosome hibernation-promoting factor, HPF/YfiA family [Limoniibacter endophyticus]|uniref:Ribosome hibernation promoting factor n=1 Tax=Limoniibacter endophyticus TaxID=1565040 RepID=A0A8J3DK15_9HYPH|nr:ribosome-associated translation inhibitor RaiA [Limoniibacter endophyticus]GHC79913.1 ribosomal subunit interface protein [Limoniibacter endophyticus]